MLARDPAGCFFLRERAGFAHEEEALADVACLCRVLRDERECVRVPHTGNEGIVHALLEDAAGLLRAVRQELHQFGVEARGDALIHLLHLAAVVGDEEDAFLVDVLEDHVEHINNVCLVDLIEDEDGFLFVHDGLELVEKLRRLLAGDQADAELAAHLKEHLVGCVVLPAVDVERNDRIGLLFELLEDVPARNGLADARRSVHEEVPAGAVCEQRLDSGGELALRRFAVLQHLGDVVEIQRHRVAEQGFALFEQIGEDASHRARKSSLLFILFPHTPRNTHRSRSSTSITFSVRDDTPFFSCINTIRCCASILPRFSSAFARSSFFIFPHFTSSAISGFLNLSRQPSMSKSPDSITDSRSPCFSARNSRMLSSTSLGMSSSMKESISFSATIRSEML